MVGKGKRISFGIQYKFPLKLFEVANDGHIVKWTRDGTGIIIDHQLFEERVMKCYPGFVQVGSFNNLRRLLRDYGFKFLVVRKRTQPGVRCLEYRHPSFKRNAPEQVPLIVKIKRPFGGHSFPLPATSKNKYTRRTLFHNPQLRMWRFVGKRGELVKNFGGDSQPIMSLPHSPVPQTPSPPTPQLIIKRSLLHNSWTCSRILAGAGASVLAASSELGKTPLLKRPRGRPRKILANPQHQASPQVDLVQHEAVEVKTESHWVDLAQTVAKNELSDPVDFVQVLARHCDHQWVDKSWEATENLLNRLSQPDLYPLYVTGFYRELSIEEL